MSKFLLSLSLSISFVMNSLYASVKEDPEDTFGSILLSEERKDQSLSLKDSSTLFAQDLSKPLEETPLDLGSRPEKKEEVSLKEGEYLKEQEPIEIKPKEPEDLGVPQDSSSNESSVVDLSPQNPIPPSQEEISALPAESETQFLELSPEEGSPSDQESGKALEEKQEAQGNEEATLSLSNEDFEKAFKKLSKEESNLEREIKKYELELEKWQQRNQTLALQLEAKTGEFNALWRQNLQHKIELILKSVCIILFSAAMVKSGIWACQTSLWAFNQISALYEYWAPLIKKISLYLRRINEARRTLQKNLRKGVETTQRFMGKGITAILNGARFFTFLITHLARNIHKSLPPTNFDPLNFGKGRESGRNRVNPLSGKGGLPPSPPVPGILPPSTRTPNNQLAPFYEGTEPDPVPPVFTNKMSTATAESPPPLLSLGFPQASGGLQLPTLLKNQGLGAPQKNTPPKSVTVNITQLPKEIVIVDGKRRTTINLEEFMEFFLNQPTPPMNTEEGGAPLWIGSKKDSHLEEEASFPWVSGPSFSPMPPLYPWHSSKPFDEPSFFPTTPIGISTLFIQGQRFGTFMEEKMEKYKERRLLALMAPPSEKESTSESQQHPLSLSFPQGPQVLEKEETTIPPSIEKSPQKLKGSSPQIFNQDSKTTRILENYFGLKKEEQEEQIDISSQPKPTQTYSPPSLGMNTLWKEKENDNDVMDKENNFTEASRKEKTNLEKTKLFLQETLKISSNNSREILSGDNRNRNSLGQSLQLEYDEENQSSETLPKRSVSPQSFFSNQSPPSNQQPIIRGNGPMRWNFYASTGGNLFPGVNAQAAAKSAKRFPFK